MRNQEQTKLAAMMATLFLAAAEALAQDQQSPASDECEESRRRIIISIADRKLAVVEGGRVVKIYATAVGADATPSPIGVFKIANRIPHPTWYGPNHNVVPPGKANPLGTRWMGISSPGVGMHGTPDDASIGYSRSHGCIRMHISDAEWLYNHVAVGTPVVIL